jgi:hypothetical protein
MRKLGAIARMLPGSVRSPIASRLRRAVLEKPALSPEDRAYLIDIYREDILQLEDLLGLDFSSWRLRHPIEQPSTPLAPIPITEDALADF